MLIPSRLDMNRILRVLRAALQPVPQLRDPRPWKFFDVTYYPTIRAVEYFVHTAVIPLIVRDNSGQTPIEVAQAMKTSYETTWQLAHINDIIGLFNKSSNSKASEAELPLGWEMVELEGGFSAYLESTINPQTTVLFNFDYCIVLCNHLLYTYPTLSRSEGCDCRRSRDPNPVKNVSNHHCLGADKHGRSSPAPLRTRFAQREK
jgi:hypothetical protein